MIHSVINTELVEDVGSTRFMDPTERALKKKIVEILKDNGRGEKHALYAEFFKKYYDVNIVPLKEDPDFTAAVAGDERVVYVSEGFITDEKTFYQLSVLFRHEMAHQLLKHHFRFLKMLNESDPSKGGKVATTDEDNFDVSKDAPLTSSSSVHNLLNILGDDEISNTRYSIADKQVVRNMIRNGKVIGGLVTEDHRQEWADLPLEKMYELLEKEIDNAYDVIVKQKQQLDVKFDDNRRTGHNTKSEVDMVKYNIAKMIDTYQDIDSESSIPGTIEDIAKHNFKLDNGRGRYIDLGPVRTKILKNIYEQFRTNVITNDQLDQYLKMIADSHPLKTIDLFSDGKVMLRSPEEKYLAVEFLKKYFDEEYLWRKKIKEYIPQYIAQGILRPEDIAEIKKLVD